MLELSTTLLGLGESLLCDFLGVPVPVPAFLRSSPRSKFWMSWAASPVC
jgi:hypothetical protein